MTLNNLGILDSDQNRMADARKEYEEALKICEAFAKQDPEQFTTDVKRLKTLPRELSIKLSLSAICATGKSDSSRGESLTDIAFRHATAFVASPDAGNQ